jgi:copper chaperone CopZ
MTRKYNLKGLDCANCAAEVENAVNKIDGVKSATVSFITMRMTIEADESDFDRVEELAFKAAKKVEPDMVITRK